MDNYEIARDRAQEYFLQFDQTAIIRRWGLQYDDDNLYVDFVGKRYCICRRTGKVNRLFDGKQAGFSEVLSIFDILCHKGKDQFLTGRYAPVNSLNGRPVSVGVGTDLFGKTASYFGENLDAFKSACLALGGVPVSMADVSYCLRVFADLPVIIKFYEKDEEFPASFTFLWDENTLSFMLYETVFYVAGCVISAICEEMKK